MLRMVPVGARRGSGYTNDFTLLFARPLVATLQGKRRVEQIDDFFQHVGLG